jgi:hypothetical protein
MITHLNEKSFQTLIQQGRPKEQFILQVVETYEINEGKIYLKVVLSDGHSQVDCFVLPQIQEQIRTEVNKGAVIKASLSFTKEKEIFLLISFSLVYRDCPVIGTPVKISHFSEISPESRKPAMIPQEVVLGQTQKGT